MSYPVLQANGWFPSGIPWAEHVGHDASHGTQGNFDMSGTSHCTLSIQVNWTDGQQAMADLVGVNYFVKAPSGSYLSRIPPMSHPYFPQAYCTSVAFAPLPVFVSKGVPPGIFSGASAMANYDRWILTCGFAVPKWRVFSDTVMARTYGVPWPEYQRNVEWVPNTSTFELQREGGKSFSWADGPAGVVGQPFNSPAAQHLQQTELHAVWHDVPSTAIFVEGTNFLNANITGALNTLNDNVFFGQPKGTVLFKSANPRVKPCPIHPKFSGYSDGDGGDPNILWDVDMIFTRFSPTPYPNSTSPNFTGHNLAPIPLDPAGRWALITTNGNSTTGTGIYPYSSFSNIFTPLNTV